MEEKPEEPYLPEDKDLLEKLQAIGPATGAPVAASEKMQELMQLQIRASLRHRKTAQDLDKSTKVYSKVLIAFACAQLIFGAFQFAFDTENSFHPILGILYLIAAGVLVLLSFGFFLKRGGKIPSD